MSNNGYNDYNTPATDLAFKFVDNHYGGHSAYVTSNSNPAGYISIQRIRGGITKLDEKFIPDSIARTGHLNNVERHIASVEYSLNDLVGDEKVSKQITDATNPLTERIVELEKVDHSHANATELDKIADGDKAKWDAAVQTVTAGTGLTATKTGTDVAIAFDDAVTFIFDCGGAN